MSGGTDATHATALRTEVSAVNDFARVVWCFDRMAFASVAFSRMSSGRERAE